jgi:cell division protein FtsN
MAKVARPQAAPRSRSGGGFLLGVFIGLVIGLAVAIGVAFYMNKTPIPFINRAKPVVKDEGPTKGPPLAGLPVGAAPAGSSPASQSAAPGKGAEAKGPEKPRFDFYKILPGGEEPLSEKELKDRLKAEKKSVAAAETTNEIYFLQAGSFQNPADADNQKARLAILGLESNVEPSVLPDKGTWYRVRLGPYRRLDEINRMRQTLAQNGIDASLVKAKDPAKSN